MEPAIPKYRVGTGQSQHSGQARAAKSCRSIKLVDPSTDGLVCYICTVIPRYVAILGPEPIYGEKRGGEINELTQ